MGLPPEPWYKHLSYFLNLLTFYWPWLPLAAAGAWLAVQGRSWWKKESDLILVLWPALYLFIMSGMSTRASWYIMPAFPALALLSARTLDRFLGEKNRIPLGRGILVLGIALVALLNLQPYALDKDRERDTRVLAPYVKYFGDKGDRVIGFNEDFYGLNNALLYYSDHAAEPLYSDVKEMAGEFQRDQTVLCVAHRGDLADIGKGISAWFPVKYADDLILISNRNLDASQVRTGGPRWVN
jgi:hypothetical protein